MQKNILYITPTIIVLLSMSMNEVVLSPTSSGNEFAFTSDPRRLILYGIAYSIATICVMRSFYFSFFLLKKNIVYFLCLILVLISFFWTKYPAKVIMNFGHFVGFILVILAAINYYKDKLGNIYNLIALTLGFSLAVSVVVSLLLPKIGIHAITGRWQGVAGNPNTLGIVCIISVWANVADYFSRKGEIRIWLKLVLLIITFIALIGARSTTAFGVSLFAFFGTWYLIRLENRPLLTKLIINAIMGWLGVVLIMSVYFLKPELLSIEGGLTMVGKDSTLTGRTALWELASNAIALKPWLGWGFDSNMTVLQHFDLFYGQFHNGYLDLLVRGGYVSLVVFVLLVMQTLIRLRALAKFEYRQAIIWFVILVCIILHNVTEASIMRETHLFWYLFVLIIYAIPSYKNVGMSLK